MIIPSPFTLAVDDSRFIDFVTGLMVPTKLLLNEFIATEHPESNTIGFVCFSVYAEPLLMRPYHLL